MISDETLELIDERFDEMQSIFLSESGADYDMDFDKEQYLESFSLDDKIEYIINNSPNY